MTISADQIEASGLRFNVTDAVATVTLNRPERRNAMTPAVWRALAAIGSALPSRVRVVVVRGAGPSFSSGIEASGNTPEQQAAAERRARATLLRARLAPRDRPAAGSP